MMPKKSDSARETPISLVLTKVGEDGLTDEQIARIFEQLGIEPDPEDGEDEGKNRGGRS